MDQFSEQPDNVVAFPVDRCRQPDSEFDPDSFDNPAMRNFVRFMMDPSVELKEVLPDYDDVEPDY